MAKIFSYIPSAYKAGKAYTAIPLTLDAAFDSVRASEGARIDSENFIEVMADNVPRIDYSLGGCPVLLTEPQAETLVFNSGWIGGVDNVSSPTDWSLSFSTGSFTFTPSLKFPSVFAANLKTTGSQRVVFERSLSVTSGNKYIASVYCEKADSPQSIGSVITFLHSGTFTYFENGIEVNGSLNISEGNYYAVVLDSSVTESTSVRFGNGTGGVVSGDISLSIPQVELGEVRSSFMLSPVGATFTRDADEISAALSALSAFNDTQGVFQVNVAALSIDNTNKSISINNGTSNERIEIRISENNVSAFFVVSPNVTSITHELIDVTILNDVRVVWDNSFAALKVNGIEVGRLDSREIPTGLNTCSFNIDNIGGLSFYGRTKELNVYDNTDSFASTFTTFNAMATFAKYNLV